jgi:hypothetical protein
MRRSSPSVIVKFLYVNLHSKVTIYITLFLDPRFLSLLPKMPSIRHQVNHEEVVNMPE